LGIWWASRPAFLRLPLPAPRPALGLYLQSFRFNLQRSPLLIKRKTLRFHGFATVLQSRGTGVQFGRAGLQLLGQFGQLALPPFLLLLALSALLLPRSALCFKRLLLNLQPSIPLVQRGDAFGQLGRSGLQLFGPLLPVRLVLFDPIFPPAPIVAELLVSGIQGSQTLLKGLLAFGSVKVEVPLEPFDLAPSLLDLFKRGSDLACLLGEEFLLRRLLLLVLPSLGFPILLPSFQFSTAGIDRFQLLLEPLLRFPQRRFLTSLFLLRPLALLLEFAASPFDLFGLPRQLLGEHRFGGLRIEHFQLDRPDAEPIAGPQWAIAERPAIEPSVRRERPDHVSSSAAIDHALDRPNVAAAKSQRTTLGRPHGAPGRTEPDDFVFAQAADPENQIPRRGVQYRERWGADHSD